MFPDKKLRQVVSDKLGGIEFIGTLEMDTIIYTMLDLEQYIGKKIDWVTGLTFEEVVELPQNNVLPSPIRRYCTEHLKMHPIFEWWQKEINEVVEMRIGFRANEENYWKDKPVRFAEINNCVGCFHRSIPLLKKMWQTHENKMQFFSDLEKGRKYNNDTLKMTDDITYEKIKDWDLQTELNWDDFDECDSGYCGL